MMFVKEQYGEILEGNDGLIEDAISLESVELLYTRGKTKVAISCSTVNGTPNNRISSCLAGYALANCNNFNKLMSLNT